MIRMSCNVEMRERKLSRCAPANRGKEDRPEALRFAAHLLDIFIAAHGDALRMIKFGYVMGFHNPRGLSKLGDADFYTAMFEHIEYLDQAGFDTIWTTEHHFVDNGYLSSVMPMMAAMAARTKRVKVGSLCSLGPSIIPCAWPKMPR